MRRWVALLLAGLAVAMAACSSDDRGSDDNRYRGFYGGVSGGLTTP